MQHIIPVNKIEEVCLHPPTGPWVTSNFYYYIQFDWIAMWHAFVPSQVYILSPTFSLIPALIAF